MSINAADCTSMRTLKCALSREMNECKVETVDLCKSVAETPSRMSRMNAGSLKVAAEWDVYATVTNTMTRLERDAERRARALSVPEADFAAAVEAAIRSELTAEVRKQTVRRARAVESFTDPIHAVYERAVTAVWADICDKIEDVRADADVASVLINRARRG